MSSQYPPNPYGNAPAYPPNNDPYRDPRMARPDNNPYYNPHPSQVPRSSETGAAQPFVNGYVNSQYGGQRQYALQTHVTSYPAQPQPPMRRQPPPKQAVYGMQAFPAGQARVSQPMNRVPSSESQTTDESSPRSQGSAEGNE